MNSWERDYGHRNKPAFTDNLTFNWQTVLGYGAAVSIGLAVWIVVVHKLFPVVKKVIQ